MINNAKKCHSFRKGLCPSPRVSLNYIFQSKDQVLLFCFLTLSKLFLNDTDRAHFLVDKTFETCASETILNKQRSTF